MNLFLKSALYTSIKELRLEEERCFRKSKQMHSTSEVVGNTMNKLFMQVILLELYINLACEVISTAKLFFLNLKL